MVLEGKKLYTNLPRFQRIDKDRAIGKKKEGLVKNVIHAVSSSEQQGQSSKEWVDKRTFVDVI